jgi:hypothetical protein
MYIFYYLFYRDLFWKFWVCKKVFIQTFIAKSICNVIMEDGSYNKQERKYIKE